MSSIARDYRLPDALQGTILADIMRSKVHAIVGASMKWPAESVRMCLAQAPPVRPFRRIFAGAAPAIIAEIKRASPSAGLLRADFDPPAIGRAYQRAGAAAISVVTEGPHFHGQIEYVATLRWQLEIPLLLKDFIIDPYQVLQARHAGADAVLLIAALLDTSSLGRLRSSAEELGMEALVEAHNEEELERALESGAALIGVNNRDLRTFQVSLDVSSALAEKLRGRKDVLAVAESGIRTGADVRRLSAAGYRGFLVGEHLMRATSPGEALARLLSDAAGGKGRAT